MSFRLTQFISFFFTTVLIFLCLSCESPTRSESSSIQLRVKNTTGFDLSDVTAKFFIEGSKIELNYKDLPDGSISEYQEMPDSLTNDDGFYYTYVNAFSDSLSFYIRLGTISPDLNPDRAVLLKKGMYTFILEYVPAELLDLSLGTQKLYDASSNVLIRIQNNSDKDFKEVIANFPGNSNTEPQEVDYGTVKSGENSGYISVQLAYRYVGITAITSEDTLKIEPTDYLGETPLDPGEYSYDLDLVPGLKDISRIVKD